jgi:hypothetical protein
MPPGNSSKKLLTPQYNDESKESFHTVQKDQRIPLNQQCVEEPSAEENPQTIRLGILTRANSCVMPVIFKVFKCVRFLCAR